MKKHLFKVITLAFLLSFSFVLTSASSWDAKFLSAGPITTFEVEFDFQIGNKSYPKGKYRLSKGDNSVLVLDNFAGKKSKVFLGIRSSKASYEASINRLTFHRYGDTYFLREIVSPALSAKISPSKEEKDLRKSGRLRLAKVRVMHK